MAIPKLHLGKPMRVRCPHCRSPIEIVDDAELSDIPCPSCGSSFSLVVEDTLTHDTKERTVAHFRLTEKLGVGAFGTVWKATDTQLDRTVAIKIPRKTQLDAQESEQFLREARAAAQLRHPNIVTVHEVGRDDGRVYIVSDFIQGATLSDWIEDRQLSPREAAQWCAKIAGALHHAHEAGVVHRDLKPSNIMIDLDDEPHIMDFGLAKREAAEITMTVDGQVMGTPAYMSPEQARGEGHAADRRCDVYSLGVILFQLLTGELPFRGNPRMLIVQILKDDPPSPRKLNGAIDKDLETICLKCLEKEPARRYGTADDLQKDVLAYLNGEPVTARPAGRFERGWRWVRRHPARAGLLAASGLATVLIVGLLVAYGYQQQLKMTNSQLADAREELEQALYMRRVSQALSAWHDGEVARMKQLLEDCPLAWRHWEWHYVKGLLDASATTLRGHTGWAVTAIFSPDGRRVLSMSSDNMVGGRSQLVKVWNAASGHELFTVRDVREPGPPYSPHPCFNPYRKQVVVASQQGTIRLFDAETGTEAAAFRAHDGRVTSVAVSPDGTRIVSAGSDHTVKVWDAATGHEILTLQGHTDIVNDVTFSFDGARIASGSSDQTVIVWSADFGRQLLRFTSHQRAVTQVVFSPDGTSVMSRETQREGGLTVMIWNTETGENIATFEDSAGSGTNAFSPDGTRVALPIREGDVMVWDFGTDSAVLNLTGHTESVRQAAYSPDGSRIVTAGNDHTVRVWDARNGDELFTFKGHTDVVSDVAFAPDGNRVVSASRDGLVRVWGADRSQEVRSLEGHTDDVVSVAFHPDGDRIASGSRDGTLKIWGAQSGQVARTLIGHTDEVKTVAFSPDGARLVSGGTDKTIRIWDAESGAEIRVIENSLQVNAVAFGPHGNQLVGGLGYEYESNQLMVWSGGSGPFTLTGHDTAVWSVAFSPDGKRIVSGQIPFGGFPADAIVWDVESRRELFSLSGHAHNIASVAVSPDGERIVTGSFDNTIKVWNSQNGKEELTVNAGSWVNCLAFSPDGQRIVAACARGTIKLWDTRSGDEALTIKGHIGAAMSVAVSRDGSRIVSGGADNTIKIWDAGTTEFIRR